MEGVYSGSHRAKDRETWYLLKISRTLVENLVTFKDTGFILSLAFVASTVAAWHRSVRTAHVLANLRVYKPWSHLVTTGSAVFFFVWLRVQAKELVLTAEELRGFIRALFGNSELRAKCLAEIK